MAARPETFNLHVRIPLDTYRGLVRIASKDQDACDVSKVARKALSAFVARNSK